MWRKGSTSALLVGMQTSTASVENSVEPPQKTKNELSFDPAVPLVGLCPTNPETAVQKNLCTPMFIAAQFITARCWKQPKCPSANEWIKNLWYIYPMKYHAAERNKELLPFVTARIDLERIMLSEISQVVKDKYHMISPISGIYSLKQRRSKI